MQPVIYFDLDGVASNFVMGAFRKFGSTLRHEDCTQWGIEALLEIDPKTFWDALGFEFWSNLELYADGFALLHVAEKLVGPENIAIVSSPCDTAGCDEGKRAWVRRHLPDYKRRCFLGGAKHLLVGPGKILVDDHCGHEAACVERGGIVVKPPRPWNSRRPECLPGGMFCPDKVGQELAYAVSFIRGQS